MNHNCPICNKAGLPDYLSTHTVCPQCNSDLKPFMILHSIAKPNSNKQTLFGLIGVGLIAFVIAALYFSSLSQNRKITNSNLNTILQFQDTIHNFQTQIARFQQFAAESKTYEKEIVIHYKVRQGDCSSRIAQFFYNDWRMYKKIEIDNNLKQPYILKVGQSLTIKLIKE